jgi:hypothetical protein
MNKKSLSKNKKEIDVIDIFMKVFLFTILTFFILDAFLIISTLILDCVFSAVPEPDGCFMRTMNANGYNLGGIINRVVGMVIIALLFSMTVSYVIKWYREYKIKK